MKTRNILILIVILLSVIQSVNSLQVTDLKFLSWGQPIIYVSYNTMPMVTARITVQGEDFAFLTANLSGINRNRAYSMFYANMPPVYASGCSVNESTWTYTCYIRGLELLLEDRIVSIPIVLSNGTNETKMTWNYDEFKMDTDNPTAISIGTEHCIEETDTCYIGNDIYTELKVSLQNGPFEKALVMFLLDGNKKRSTGCNGPECTVRAKTTCVTGQTITLQLAPLDTMDDAYNPLSNRISRSLVCDSERPIVNESNITITSDSRFGEKKEGDMLTIKAVVVEDNDGLIAYMNATELNGEDKIEGSCVKNDDENYECTIIVDDVNPGDFDQEIIFRDIVGNEITVTKNIIVNSILRDEVPECFSIAKQELIPKEIDRIILQLTIDNGIEFPVFGEYTLSGSGCSNTRALHQEITLSTCEYVVVGVDDIAISNIFSEIKVANEKTDKNDNRVNFIFKSKSRTNSFHNQFNVVCNMSIVVADSRGVYENPEQEILTFTFNLKNSQLGSPGERFVKKMQKYEDNALVNSKILDIANKFYGTASDICSIGAVLDIGEAAAVTLSIAGLAVEVITAGASTALTKVGMKTYDVTNNLQEKLKGSISNNILGIVGKMCDLSTCTTASKEDAKDLGAWSSGMNDIASSFPFGLGDGAANPSLDKSLILSLATFCLPAVVQHLSAIRDNECRILGCLKMNSVQGYDINGCEEIRATYACNFVFGEAMELFTPTRILRNVADNFRHMVQNILPLSAFAFIDKVLCKKIPDRAAPGATAKRKAQIVLCNVPDSIGRFIMQDSLTTSARDFMYTPSDDTCNAIKECSGEELLNGECEFDRASLLGNYGDIPRPSNEELRNLVQARRGEAISKLDSASVKRSINKAYANRLYRQANPDVPIEWIRFPYSDEDVHNLETYFPGDHPTQSLDEYIEPHIEAAYNANDATVEARVNDINRAGSLADFDSTVAEEVRDRRVDTNVNEFINDQLTGPYAEDAWVPLNNQHPLNSDGTVLYDTNGDGVPDKAVELDGSVYETGTSGRALGIPISEEGAPADAWDLVSSEDGNNVYDTNNDGKPDTIKTSTGEFYATDDNGIQTGEELTTGETHTTPDANIDANNDEINKLGYGDKTDTEVQSVIDAAERARKQREADLWNDKMEKGVTLASKFIYNYLIKDRYTLNTLFPEHTLAGEVSTFVDTYLSSETWKNSICNPDSGLLNNIWNTGNEGVVHECDGSTCALVLTFGSERVPFNDTHYLYSMTYLFGQVSEDVKFNVYLKTSDDIRNYKYESMETLPAGEIDKFAGVMIRGDYFDEMCVEFEEPFPPNRIPRADTKYCRDIKEDIYSTGNPVAFDSSGDPIIEDNSEWHGDW